VVLFIFQLSFLFAFSTFATILYKQVDLTEQVRVIFFRHEEKMAVACSTLQQHRVGDTHFRTFSEIPSHTSSRTKYCSSYYQK